MPRALVIAILGAESTGKTALAQALSQRLADETDLACTWVGEYLRDWCEREGRTPRHDEQRMIALVQQQRIEAAATAFDIVVADTTPLMTACYSALLFDDDGLLADAVAVQRCCDLTLLTALDLPWIADGLQRDGPHVRAPVDAWLRSTLAAQGLAWSVVRGEHGLRLECALDAVTPLVTSRNAPRAGLFTRLQQRDAAQPARQWTCENCDVPDCEHALARLARHD